MKIVRALLKFGWKSLSFYFYVVATLFGHFNKNQCIREKTEAQNKVQEIKQYQKKWLQHV
jgi:hypothetical protein